MKAGAWFEIVGTIAILASLFSSIGLSTQYVSDGGFETSFNGGNNNSYWNTTINPEYQGYDTSSPLNGTWSFYCVYRTIEQYYNVTNDMKGQNFTVSAWMRVDGGETGSANLKVIDAVNDTVLSYIYLGYNASNQSQQFISDTFIMPETDLIKIQMYPLSMMGLIDDVSLIGEESSPAPDNFTIVSNIFPLNSTSNSSNDILLGYEVSASGLSPSCSLLLNMVVNQTNASAVNGSLNTFLLSGLANASYDWHVDCTAGGMSNASGEWTFMIEKAYPVAPEWLNLAYLAPASLIQTSGNNVTFTALPTSSQPITACYLRIDASLFPNSSVVVNNTAVSWYMSMANGSYVFNMSCLTASQYNSTSNYGLTMAVPNISAPPAPITGQAMGATGTVLQTVLIVAGVMMALIGIGLVISEPMLGSIITSFFLTFLGILLIVIGMSVIG